MDVLVKQLVDVLQRVGAETGSALRLAGRALGRGKHAHQYMLSGAGSKPYQIECGDRKIPVRISISSIFYALYHLR